jgi:hypothetical protein
MPRDFTQIEISQAIERSETRNQKQTPQRKLGIRTMAVVTLCIAKSNQLGEVPGDY